MKIESSAVSLQASSKSQTTVSATKVHMETLTRGSQQAVSLQDAAAMLQALKDSKGKYNGDEKLKGLVSVSGVSVSASGFKTSLSALGGFYLGSKGEAESAAAERQNRSLAADYKARKASAAKHKERSPIRTLEELQTDLFKMMWEALTGRKLKDGLFKSPKISFTGGEADPPALSGYGEQGTEAESEFPNQANAAALANGGTPKPSPASNSGQAYLNAISYTAAEYSLKQSYSFNASAIVNTADGKSINVSLQLNMSSEVYSKFESLSVNSQALKDPLVINFAAPGAALTDTKFRFDLDADGTSCQISQLAAGSGFLALDAYGDGSVRDGNQLFGVQSGNGFADLAKYDADFNGWIDENDEIFDKLRIWHVGESGEQRLIGLGEVGIGAIFLGCATGDYQLFGEDAQNGSNGVVRSSGVFLREDGTAGTVQHVDLRI